MLELEILLDNNMTPYFSPGNTICGQVRVKNCGSKDIKIDELRVDFVGQELVKWKGTPFFCCYGFGYYYERKVYQDGVAFIQETCHLLGDGIISPGVQLYPFIFRLPRHCPSSCQTDLGGHIAYILIAKLKRPGLLSSNLSDALALTVNGVLDLTHLPGIEEPVTVTRNNQHKKFGMVLEIPKQGFIVGEEIPFRVRWSIDISANNRKTIHNKYPIVQLIMVVRLFAKSLGKYSEPHTTVLDSKAPSHLNGVDGRDENANKWVGSGKLQLPFGVEPSNLGGSEYIEVNYWVMVDAFDIKEVIGIPITVGTVGSALEPDLNHMDETN